MKRTASIAMTLVLSVGALTLAGCGGSSDQAADSGQTEEVGGDPGTWAPVEITQSANDTTIDMVVGQNAIFTDLPDSPTIDIISTDPSVVEAILPQADGESTSVGGLTALAAGESIITVMDTAMPEDGGASQVIIQFTVNVTE